MAGRQERQPEAARRQVAEAAWLDYFNRFLFAQDLITERQHNQMTGMISDRNPSATKR